MSYEILTSLIGFAGVCVGAIFGYLGKSRKHATQEAKREQEHNDKLDRLFEELREVKIRLDEHNHYAEKIGGIERKIAVMQKDIEYIRKDLK